MKFIKIFAGVFCLLAMAACAPIQHKSMQKQALECTPMPADDPMVGNWLSIGSQKGVAGALRTLYTLNADGTMNFVQQIKRSQSPSQGIAESGCWQRNGEILVLKTDKSNGLPVNLDDPIYTSNYHIISMDENELQLQGDNGLVTAKKVSSGYRLPF